MNYEKFELLFWVAIFASVVTVAVTQQLKINIENMEGWKINLTSFLLNAVIVPMSAISLFDYGFESYENYVFLGLAVIVAFGEAEVIYKAFKDKISYLKENPITTEKTEEVINNTETTEEVEYNELDGSPPEMAVK